MGLRYVESQRLGRGSCIGITAVAFSTHGKYLAASALDGKVRIWNVKTGQLLYVFSSTVPKLSLAWAGPKEDTLLCGLKDGTICCLFATEMDLQVIGFSAHTYPVEYLTVRDGVLASGAHEEVRIWKLKEGAWAQETMLPAPPKTSFNRRLQVVVTSIHWLGEAGRRVQLLVTYLNHGVHIFDATTWEQIRSVTIPGQIADASISSDGQLMAISNVLTGFDVYFVDSGAALCSFGHTVSEFRKVPVLFVHNAVALLGGNLQGDVHLWDVTSGQKLHSLLHPKEDQILALAAHYNPSSDTFLIATGVLQGSSEYAVVLWKAEESGQQEEHADVGKGWLPCRMTTLCASLVLPILAATYLVLNV